MANPLSRRDFSRLAGLLLPLSAAAQKTQSNQSGDSLNLSNGKLTAVWEYRDSRLTSATVAASGHTLKLPPDLFALTFQDGRTVKSSELALAGPPKFQPVAADPRSIRRAGLRPGRALTAEFRDSVSGASIAWRAVLLDGAAYLRHEFTIAAGPRDLPITEIALWNGPVESVAVQGTVKGSPAVSGNFYLAFEHPLSTTKVTDGALRCALPRTLPVRAGQSFHCSSVAGAVADGQLRRDFLAYVEEERAHPYRTFLHYNSWYDIGYFSKYDEEHALDRIHAFGKELHLKRGVTLDSYLFDDGWDDPATLWSFHSGFPQGFTRMAKAVAEYKAGIGVWLSPWGGYGKPKQDRIQLGGQQGFEIQDGGFALSGPKYYQRFTETCHKMMTDFGVNQFKIDGTGNANKVFPGSQFDSDFDAAINLIADLRRSKPDLYVNLTTGTYPSPFWLRYADSIWRGGSDHSFAGVGPQRQRWITYRDSDTYRHVVTAGPLYPMNSLMLHGLIYAAQAKDLGDDPTDAFRSEIHDYFGTGTQLQEMYVTPSLLSSENWDDLAEAARWSRGNAGTLVDTHWVGGNPGNLEVYGWASWSPAKGILTLRNPSDKPQSITLDPRQVFELPLNAPARYAAASPWKADAGKDVLALEAGKAHEFTLAPFEVLNLEALPR